VVECRGCFWHSCPEHAVAPKSNLDYWTPKLARNVERDERNAAADRVEAAVRTSRKS
jgi:DNA mismatch endonuclease (patch repair protein)